MTSSHRLRYLGLTLSLAALFLSSCDTSAPAPAGDELSFDSIFLFVTNAGTTETRRIEILGITDPGSEPASADTLDFGPLDTLNIAVSLRDGSREATAPILSHAEQYEFFYEPVGLPAVTVDVVDRESDYGQDTVGGDQEVGLHAGMTVDFMKGGGTGGIRLRLYHYEAGAKTGRPDGTLLADVLIPARVPRPLPGVHNFTSIRITATGPRNEFRAAFEGDPVYFNSGQPLPISFPAQRGEVTFFTIEPFLGNQSLLEEIVDEGTTHQMFFEIPDVWEGKVAAIPVRDHNGLPLGISFALDVSPDAPAVQGARLGLQLDHFDDPADKDGTRRSGKTDLDIVLPIDIQ